MAHLALRAMKPGDNNFGAYLAHALHKVHKRKLKRRKQYKERKQAAALAQQSELRDEPAMQKTAHKEEETEKKKATAKGKLRRKGALSLSKRLNARRRRINDSYRKKYKQERRFRRRGAERVAGGVRREYILGRVPSSMMRRRLELNEIAEDLM